MDDAALIREKIAQAAGLLGEFGLDLWLTFTRETSAAGDPVLPLIYGHDLTWQSALILTADGDHTAIVGRFEADAARQLGVYNVIPYDQDVRADLLAVLRRLNPGRIGINTSTSDVLADGLSHGMFLLLTGYLGGTPFTDRLVSAEGMIGALRARKVPAEIERIRRAVRTTEQIYANTLEMLAPGLTERQVGAFMHAQVDSLGLATAWERASCPAVNSGPDSPVGHGSPTEIVIEPGHLVHFDFGVKQDGYCADIQRMAYVLRRGETRPPPEVQRGFDTVVAAIRAAAAAMQVGVRGANVDSIARDIITSAGYPEYRYATGHQLGRVVHDGGALLGPRWERYGNLPDQRIEAGHVYTIEPGLMVEGYGYIGIEEDVLVTEDGTVFLSELQAAPALIRA